MRTQTALLLLVCLFALPWLASCGQARPTIITRTQLIDHPVVRYRPMPTALTAELAGPPTPAAHCTDAAGQPAVCALDALATIPLWRGVVEQANVDRKDAATLGEPASAASTGAPHD